MKCGLQTIIWKFSVSFPDWFGTKRTFARENRTAMGNSRGTIAAYPSIQGTRRWFRGKTPSRCNETSCPSSQFAQIHGDVFATTHLLLTLQRLHLGPWQAGVSVPNMRMCSPQAMPRVHHNKVFWSQKVRYRWREYLLDLCLVVVAKWMKV